MKKLQGGFAPYMMGLLLGIAAVSTSLNNDANLSLQQLHEKYIEQKRQYNENFAKSLELNAYEETAFNATVDASLANRHFYTNIFDLNDSVTVGSTSGTSGERQILLTNSGNENTQNIVTSTTNSTTKLEQLNDVVVYDEKAVRRNQLLHSYENMKKEAVEIYQSLLGVSAKSLPASAPKTYKDAWGNDFVYTKTDSRHAKLSLVYPWDNSKKLELPITLPEALAAPIETGIKQVLQTDGQRNTFLLLYTGELYVSGDNGNSRLGLGDTVRRVNWVKVLTDIDYLITYDLQTELDTPFAVAKNGDLWVAGEQTEGQFGLGNTTRQDSFVKILTDVKQVEVRDSTLYVLKNTGDLVAAGKNSLGRVCNGGVASPITTFNTIDTSVKSFKLSDSSVYFLKNNKELWGCGNNYSGKLGVGDTDNKYSPVRITTDVADYYVPGSNVYVIKSNRDLYAAGYNGQYNIGDGTNNAVHTIKKVASGIDDFAADDVSHAYVSGGKLYVTGYNVSGKLGYSATRAMGYATDLTYAASDVANFDFHGYNKGFVTKTNNDIYAGGYSRDSELGTSTYCTDFSPPCRTTFRPVNYKRLVDVYIKDTINDANATYLDINSDLWGAGRSLYGEIGVASGSYVAAVKALSDVRSFSRDSYRIIAVTKDDKLYVSGRDQYGELGNSGSSNISKFEVDATDVKRAFLVKSYAVFIEKNNGDIMVRGHNGFGQLGVGNTSQVNTFTKITLPE